MPPDLYEKYRPRPPAGPPPVREPEPSEPEPEAHWPHEAEPAAGGPGPGGAEADSAPKTEPARSSAPPDRGAGRAADGPWDPPATLPPFVQLIRPRAGLSWTDLGLAWSSLRQIREVRQRIGKRSALYDRLGFGLRLDPGRSVTVLLTGPRGTGKALAAELLAGRHGADLLRVDTLSFVTQPEEQVDESCRALFACAGPGPCFLSFRRAEVLFRYAGAGGQDLDARRPWAVSRLWAAIEDFDGAVLLSTHTTPILDEGTLRRLSVVVEFPVPGPEQAVCALRRLCPEAVTLPPDDELEPLLKRAQLPNASLESVLLDAVFRALGPGEPPRNLPIALHHLVAAVSRESQRLGRPIPQAELRAALRQPPTEGRR